MTTTKKTPRKRAPKKVAPVVEPQELEDKITDLAKGDGLCTDWFCEDKTPEDRKKTKDVLTNSTIQFRLLRRIIEKMFKQRVVTPVDLDKPNLEYRVVYNEGYRQALKELYRLLP